MKIIYYRTSVIVGYPNGAGINELTFYETCNGDDKIIFKPFQITLFNGNLKRLASLCESLTI